MAAQDAALAMAARDMILSLDTDTLSGTFSYLPGEVAP